MELGAEAALRAGPTVVNTEEQLLKAWAEFQAGTFLKHKESWLVGSITRGLRETGRSLQRSLKAVGRWMEIGP